jgi:hypothetical protein
VEFTGRLDPSSIITSEGEDFKRILTCLNPRCSKEGSEIPPIWYRLVTQYSRRQLTRPTDRLPAISGLASAIYDATGHTYLAGIWKEDLNDLLWFLDSDLYYTESPPKALSGGFDSPNFARRLSALSAEDYGYQAPSWSWASIPRPVYYCGRGDETRIINENRDMKIIDANIAIAGIDLFSRVSSGYLQVRGYTLPLDSRNILHTDLPKLDYNVDKVELYIPRGSVSASLLKRRGGGCEKFVDPFRMCMFRRLYWPSLRTRFG